MVVAAVGDIGLCGSPAVEHTAKLVDSIDGASGETDAWTKKWLNDYWLEGMFGTAFDEAKGVPAPGK